MAVDTLCVPSILSCRCLRSPWLHLQCDWGLKSLEKSRRPWGHWSEVRTLPPEIPVIHLSPCPVLMVPRTSAPRMSSAYHLSQLRTSYSPSITDVVASVSQCQKHPLILQLIPAKCFNCCQQMVETQLPDELCFMDLQCHNPIDEEKLIKYLMRELSKRRLQIFPQAGLLPPQMKESPIFCLWEKASSAGPRKTTGMQSSLVLVPFTLSHSD